MSYRITIYCDDPTISTTKAYVDGLGQTFTASYKAQGEYTVSGLSGYTKFTAKAATDCSFVRWEYWIGTPTGSPYTVRTEEFVYTYEQDVYVRAIGEYNEVDSDWEVYDSLAFEDIDGWIESVDCHMSPNDIFRVKVTFARSGYAHFYTEGYVDTLGYLSDSPEWNQDRSGPRTYLESDDDSYDGRNFDIGYYVEADTEYYLFVRGSSGTEDGYIKIFALNPWDLDSTDLGYPEADYQGSEISYPYTLHRREMRFSKSGKLVINAGASAPSEMWISTSPDWYYNFPEHPLSEISLEAEDSVFLECDVVADETYYLWFRNNTSSMALFLYTIYDVEETEVTAVKKWDWNKSNGSASDDETFNAFWAAEFKEVTTNFSYKVWNDIVSKAQEYLNYTERGSWTIGSNNYGYPESTTYTALLANAKMTASDTTLYAQKFNIVRFCIGCMATFNTPTKSNAIYRHYVSTGSWDMSAGEDVLGGYILALVSKMDEI